MLARHNLPRVLEETSGAKRVLDVGGCYSPLNTATHVIDCLGFDEAKAALSPHHPVRFDRSTWVVADICAAPWPFPDGYFDYAFCSHALEDVRDPLAVCRELVRVARAGYIETPSRLREAFHHKRGYLWRRLIGRPLRVGFNHHRWFVEAEAGGLVFTAKTIAAIQSAQFFITAEELRRQLTPDEEALTLFWSGTFAARERLLVHPGEAEEELMTFKRRTLAHLK